MVEKQQVFSKKMRKVKRRGSVSNFKIQSLVAQPMYQVYVTQDLETL